MNILLSKLKFIIPILLLIFFVQNCEADMFKFLKGFKKVTIEVFPPVSGKLTLNGIPLEGIKIRRSYEYIDAMKEEKSDYTNTDKNGNFSFPEITIKSSHPNKPLSISKIWQGIKIEDKKNSDVYLWHAFSTGIKHNPYYVNMLKVLNCDLKNNEKPLQIINPKYTEGSISYTIDSICRWPEQVKIEKKKLIDLEKNGELKPAEYYGDIIDNR